MLYRRRRARRCLHRRFDVLVVAEQVRGIVPVLQVDEPIVIPSEGGPDAIGPLLDLETDVIDIIAAG
jgi:hypothetical protein